MLRLSLATLLGLCLAAAVAWRLGGTLGGGVMAGFSLGAGLSGIGALYQRHVLRTKPEAALMATGVSFLAKLGALLFGALAFRYIEAAAARADWKAFLVSFAAAVVIVLPLGVLDATAGRARGRSGGERSPAPESGRRESSEVPVEAPAEA